MALFKKKKITERQKRRLRIIGRSIFIFQAGLVIGIMLIIGGFNDNFPFKATDYIKNRFSTASYNAVMYSHYDDNITIEIANLCGRFNMADEQIQCMQAQILFFYNYTEVDNHSLNNPDKYYEEGGVCRDMVILQKSILLKMGWQAYYRFPMPNHVSLSAYRQVDCSDDVRVYCNTYCDIDGKYYECH